DLGVVPSVVPGLAAEHERREHDERDRDEYQCHERSLHGAHYRGRSLDSRTRGDENREMRWLLVAVLVCAGCGRKKDDARCDAVATRLFTLAREDLAKATVDPATRGAVADQLPAMRDALKQACSDGKWSTQLRNCTVA